MTIDYSNDDSRMVDMYVESMYHTNSKLPPRGNPNTRLSYASYFEEEDAAFHPGEIALYGEPGQQVNVVDVDTKSMTVTIELPDETTVFDVPVSQLSHLD